MSRLFIAGPKSRLESVVSKLHELKAAHIIEHKKDEFDICQPLRSFEKTSSMLVQVRSIMSHFKIQSAERAKIKFKIAELEKNIELMAKEINEAGDQVKKAESEISLIDSKKKALKLMADLNVSPDDFVKSKHIKSYIGYVSADLSGKLESISKNFELRSAKQDKSILIALFADSRHEKQFDKALDDASFSQIDTGAANGLKGNALEIIKIISKKRESIEAELSAQKAKLKEVVLKHSGYLADAEKFLSAEAEKSQAPLSFGSTREAFFIKSYVPESDAENIKAEIAKSADGRIYISEEQVSENEDVPVKLNNPKGISSFEFFTNLYSLPKYGEFDPTFLMAFTFPLFFGFMLGDIGYGLVTLAFFYILRRKYPIGRPFFSILMVSSASAVIFGLIYGEVFGYEAWHGLITRAHDINALMLISIIAGVVQINLGLLLGFILELRHHGFFMAACKKLSWMLLQVSGALLYASYQKIIPLPAYSGYALLAVSVLMLVKGEGFMGIMEIPSIVSHTVSYARLMAVGLASVFIAVMVNDFAGFLFHKGIFLIPLAVIALLIGHLFNIALGVLSPSLHSIRLHYVEFFTKFYTGGGTEYAPFGAERQKSLF